MLAKLGREATAYLLDCPVVSAAFFSFSVTHLLKNARSSAPDPFALPAAGLPIDRGGNCFAFDALHFLAISAVRANALVGSWIIPTTMSSAAAVIRRGLHMLQLLPY